MRATLQHAVLDCLRKHRDGVTMAEFMDAVYGDDPDGGPLHAENNIHVTICKLRKQGLQIERRTTYCLIGRGIA